MWTCPLCNQGNDPSLAVCQSCQCPKPEAVAPLPPKKEGEQRERHYRPQHRDERPPETRRATQAAATFAARHVAHISRRSSRDWECRGCRKRNDAHVRVCAHCELPNRPGRPPSSSRSQIKCYECGQVGHISRNCPKQRGGAEYPDVGSIHPGKVAGVRDFGAFVQMDGFRKQGLVHISQLCDYRVNSTTDVVEEGDRVYVKVGMVEKETGKISLSMKYVSQKDGKDLDPDGRGAASEFRKTSERSNHHDPVDVTAAYQHAKCTRCGGIGHLSSECYVPLGADKFEMVVDETLLSQEPTVGTNTNAIPVERWVENDC